MHTISHVCLWLLFGSLSCAFDSNNTAIRHRKRLHPRSEVLRSWLRSIPELRRNQLLSKRTEIDSPQVHDDVREINKILGKPITDPDSLATIKDILLDNVHQHFQKKSGKTLQNVEKYEKDQDRKCSVNGNVSCSSRDLPLPLAYKTRTPQLRTTYQPPLMSPTETKFKEQNWENPYQGESCRVRHLVVIAIDATNRDSQEEMEHDMIQVRKRLESTRDYNTVPLYEIVQFHLFANHIQSIDTRNDVKFEEMETPNYQETHVARIDLAFEKAELLYYKFRLRHAIGDRDCKNIEHKYTFELFLKNSFIKPESTISREIRLRRVGMLLKRLQGLGFTVNAFCFSPCYLDQSARTADTNEYERDIFMLKNLNDEFQKHKISERTTEKLKGKTTRGQKRVIGEILDSDFDVSWKVF